MTPIGLGGKILLTGMVSVMVSAILAYIDEYLTDYVVPITWTKWILFCGGVSAFFVGGLLEIWL